MTIKNKIVAVVFLALSSVLAAGELGAFYRYKDDNGNIVIDRSIPADKVKGGYEVLSESGRVIKVVDREMTAEEIAAMTDKQRAEKNAEEKRLKQREYDLQLLRRYSFVGDIEAEKDRKVREMEAQSQIYRANLLGVRNELEMEYEKAAKFEKKGSQVPEHVTKRITSLEEKLSNTEELMQNLLDDMEDTRKEYLLAIERFKELKSIK